MTDKTLSERPLATRPDLIPLGREIINCCHGRGTLSDFQAALAR